MFRSSYLDYAQLTAQLQSWAEQHPALVRLTSLAVTPEGRNVWLLTVGPDPDRIRPAAWVDGNVHAAELAGSSVALAIADAVLRLHTEPHAAPLPAPIAERLRDVLFYIVPRISPDGAECVITTGRSLRSVPRDERVERGQPRWVLHAIDGDGLSLSMRVPDPGGELVESKDFPGLLVERTLEDDGP